MAQVRGAAPDVPPSQSLRCGIVSRPNVPNATIQRLAASSCLLLRANSWYLLRLENFDRVGFSGLRLEDENRGFPVVISWCGDVITI